MMPFSRLLKKKYDGRGERIRTSDSCVPNAVLYQAELHPAKRKIKQSTVIPAQAGIQPTNKVPRYA
jgi:hypothetical protein